MLLKKTLAAAAVSLVLSIPITVNASNDLPEIGTAGAAAITIDKEKQYGRAFSIITRANQPIVDDPLLSEYISELGNKLVANADSVKFPFNFFLVRDNEINAAAFFGGHIMIHTGLFLYAETESQLASVLAHEISHVTQRHLARITEAQAKSNPATLAALAGSILLAIASPQAGLAAMQTTLAANMQANINYTRSHEFEADRIGLKTLARSGYDPREMAGFFGKMAAQYRYASVPPQMLLTHPLPETRISEARTRASQYPNKYIAPSLDYQLAKSRIEVRMGKMSAEAALTYYQGQLKNKTFKIKEAALYGQALALMQLNKEDEADGIINQLMAKDPDNLFYIDVKTDLDLARNKNKDAINRLSRLYKNSPESPVVAINLANSYLEDKAFKDAAKVLERYLRSHPKSVIALSMNIKVQRALGDLGKAHQSRAEYLALHGNFRRAIDEMTSAMAATDSALDKARMEASIAGYKKTQEQLDSLR